MNLQQLYYFLTIVQKRNYTRASEQLRVTQSTLSHSINDLERELNAPLFIRSGRSIRLTRFGEILLEHVEPALELLEEAKAKLKDMTDPESGMVSISYLSSLSELVTFTISRYYAELGRIQSRFRFKQATTQEIEVDLESGAMELAFTTETDDPNLECHQIGTHETVVIVSDQHPLARYQEIRLSSLRHEKLITYESCCQIRAYIDNILQNAGVRPNVIFETTNDNLIISSVSANFGIALIPKPLSSHTIPVRALRILDDIPPRAIALAWRKSRYLSRAAENFASFVIKNSAVLDEYLKTERCGAGGPARPSAARRCGGQTRKTGAGGHGPPHPFRARNAGPPAPRKRPDPASGPFRRKRPPQAWEGPTKKPPAGFVKGDSPFVFSGSGGMYGRTVRPFCACLPALFAVPGLSAENGFPASQLLV